jgi:hypothetical protein
MSGSVEHILETMVVPELKRIADALEVVALGSEVITGAVKEAVAEDKESRKPIAAREVTRIPPAKGTDTGYGLPPVAPAPPRVPRARAQL